MKIKSLKIVVVAMFATHAFVSAAPATLEDTIPNELPFKFINGEAADADQVNANFEYLQEKIESLQLLLAQQNNLTTNTIATGLKRFSGTYSLNAIETQFLVCDPAIGDQAIDLLGVSNSRSSGTAVAEEGVLTATFSTFLNSAVNRGVDTANSGYSFMQEVEDDEAIFNVDEAGIISGPAGLTGQMNNNGNSFTVMHQNQDQSETEAGCSESTVTLFTGIRTSMPVNQPPVFTVLPSAVGGAVGTSINLLVHDCSDIDGDTIILSTYPKSPFTLPENAQSLTYTAYCRDGVNAPVEAQSSISVCPSGETFDGAGCTAP